MMRNNIPNTLMLFSVTAMVALSSSLSMADTDVNNISANPLSWNQLPPAIQNYYQKNAKLNKLKLKPKDIVAIRTWHDVNGSNYLLQFQRIQPLKDIGDVQGEKGEIVAHLYVEKDESIKRLWQVYDYVPCYDLDLTAKFVDKFSRISDIDNNELTEVSLPFYLGCNGGVDPYGMKIIMYEGQQKFAVRGNSAICNAKTGQPIDATGYYGGDYKIDEKSLQQSALSASQKVVFRRHLQTVWRDNQCSLYFKYDD